MTALLALPAPALAQAAAQGRAAAALAAPVLGQWFTEGGKSRVEIKPCGETLCGEIVWLQEPNDEQGRPKTDQRNPDEAMQSRPILGLKLLNGFVRDGDKNVWKKGKIYNPEDGKTYSAELTLDEPGQLEVRGYVGLPMFGKSQTWTRAK